jgi:hypothetical protein
LKRFIQRAWFYFRIGYNSYFAFIVGAIQFLVLTYYLFIDRFPQLAFMNLLLYVLIAVPSITALSVFVGYLHFRKLGAAQAEADISTITNPFIMKIYIPALLKTLQIVTQIADKADVLAPEQRTQIEKLEKDMNILLRRG